MQGKRSGSYLFSKHCRCCWRVDLVKGGATMLRASFCSNPLGLSVFGSMPSLFLGHRSLRIAHSSRLGLKPNPSQRRCSEFLKRAVRDLPPNLAFIGKASFVKLSGLICTQTIPPSRSLTFRKHCREMSVIFFYGDYRILCAAGPGS